MYVTAVVLAAGKGLRLKSRISKPLIKIHSQPLIIYSLKTLSKHPDIKDIIAVANRQNLEDICRQIKRYRIDKIKDVVLGGRWRQISVANALRAMDKETDLVLIHDGVRPFIHKEMVSSAIKAAKIYGAAIVGFPVKATIKEVHNLHQSRAKSSFIVRKTLNRTNLWEIQTPQVFRKELILKAYDKFGKIHVTDEAMLVEKLGVKVRVVKGACENIKITTPEDLVLAEAIAKKLVTNGY